MPTDSRRTAWRSLRDFGETRDPRWPTLRLTRRPPTGSNAMSRTHDEPQDQNQGAMELFLVLLVGHR